MKKKVIKKRKSADLPADIILGDLDQYEIDFSFVDDVKCECGSEKTYGKDATHSLWCPKHKKV